MKPFFSKVLVLSGADLFAYALAGETFGMLLMSYDAGAF